MGQDTVIILSVHLIHPIQTKVIAAEINISHFYNGNQFTIALLSTLNFGALLHRTSLHLTKFVFHAIKLLGSNCRTQ
jgi:hypothetical protein